MSHHLYHEKKHEGHAHYVCPNCHGQGWVDNQPSSDQESDALRKYVQDLQNELKAAENRLSSIT